MHRVQRTAESAQPRLPQTTFPQLDEVSVQLFIDHATAKLRTAPPVVKAELKRMVPTGPPLGESAIPCDFCDVKNVDWIAESSHKNRITVKCWNVIEFAKF